MYITVERAMQLGPLQRSSIISGRGGMNNLIKSVTVMDVPDIKNWLKGNEFVLTNVFAIKDDVTAQKKLIKDLYAKNVAALGIKLRRFIETVPKEMLQLSNELNIPIIEIPADCSWIDIIDPIYQEIVNEQYKELEATLKVHNLLMNVALQGNGLDALCEAIRTLINKPVAILNSQNSIMAVSEEELRELVMDVVNNVAIIKHMQREEIDSHCKFYSFSNSKLDKQEYIAYFMIIENEGRTQGYFMILVNRNDHLNAQDVLTLERASIVAALEIVDWMKIQNMGRVFINEFLAELIEGTLVKREEIQKRARFFDLFLYDSYNIVLIDLRILKRSFEQLGKLKQNEIVIHGLRSTIITNIKDKIHLLKDALIYDKGDYLTIFLPEKKEIVDNFDEIISRIAKVLKNYQKNCDIKIGVGSWRDITSINKSYKDAYYALSICKTISSKNVVYFNDIGVLKTFITKRGELDLDNMKEIYNRTIKPIIDYDSTHNANLLSSLQEYYKNDMSIEKTSQKLFIHVNTLRYRIEKIEKLISVDLKKSEDLFNVYLGLKIHFFFENVV